MLQQTQVATVIPYFERFLRRFPTVKSLAQAPLDEVLALWSGLGYYSRARNLHRAARIVAEEFDGKFPPTAEGLRDLPGVGRYTAAAISSIAFGRREALVDGNVTRVLSRLFDVREDVTTATGQKRIWSLAESLLPQRRCGAHNESLMELGATICIPSAPNCSDCPVRRYCLSRKADTVASRPLNGSSPRVQSERHVIVALQRGDRWLCRKRPAKGLWGGLWELPTAVLNGQSPQVEARNLARRFTIGRVHLNRNPFCRFERRLTHRRIEFIGFAGQIKSINPVPGRYDGHWKTLAEIERLGVSTAVREVIAALREQFTSGSKCRH
jgi:A/G-specific adenine glycosylase